MTCSMPLSGESRPNVKMTDFCSIPSRSSLVERGGIFGIPCGMRSILSLVDAVHLPQDRAPLRAHDDDSLGELEDLVEHRALVGVRRVEDGVERRDDRHPQLAQERADEAARLAAEDSELVLEADHIDGVHVEEVGGAPVGGEVRLGDLEADAGRIVVPCADLVHRQDEAVGVGGLVRDRVREVRGERGDAALARRVVAEHRNGPDGGRAQRARNGLQRGPPLTARVSAIDEQRAPGAGRRPVDEEPHPRPEVTVFASLPPRRDPPSTLGPSGSRGWRADSRGQ